MYIEERRRVRVMERGGRRRVGKGGERGGREEGLKLTERNKRKLGLYET